MPQKKAIIVGAGPAGLTAAYELLQRTEITPLVLEKTDVIGGIARTMVYKGNRFDIGPHRFFSKSDRVMDWWAQMIPLEAEGGEHQITYQSQTRTIKSDGDTKPSGPDDNRMILLKRKTRIYYMRKFFDYPIWSGRGVPQVYVRSLRANGIKYNTDVFKIVTIYANVFRSALKLRGD